MGLVFFEAACLLAYMHVRVLSCLLGSAGKNNPIQQEKSPSRRAHHKKTIVLELLTTTSLPEARANVQNLVLGRYTPRCRRHPKVPLDSRQFLTDW